MIGSYVLLIELANAKRMRIGKLGDIDFPSYWYVYVGSAMNGIENRIKRHFSPNKKYHWHIDYFLDNANLRNAYYKLSYTREECNIAQRFSKKFNFIPFFGSSDCKCNSHLFYGRRNDLKEVIDLINMNDYNEKKLI